MPRIEFKVTNPLDQIKESAKTIFSQIIPAIVDVYRDGINRHNEANRKLIGNRDALIRRSREVASGDYATISPESHFYAYYKYLVGGKNYSLSKLKLRINPEFGRTAEFFSLHSGAYERFLNNNKVISNLDRLSIKISYDKLKADFEFRNPGKKFMVSVRSSGTLLDSDGLPVAGGEDSKDNAFAGLNETLLNVSSFEDLIEAIEFCFNQCGNEAATAYMISKGVDQTMARLPLVVQEMVFSESFADFAGIIFLQSKLNPEVGSLNVISGMNEYAVGGQASRYLIDFDKVTGEIINTNRVKQKKALLSNPFSLSSKDTKLDIVLPHIMEDRINVLETALENNACDKNFYDLVRAFHLIKTQATEQELIAIARNLLTNKQGLLRLSRELDTIDDNPENTPSPEYFQKIIQQAMHQEKEFGYKVDMEFVNDVFLQVRPLTGSAVPIQKGPDSELKRESIATGMIASPGVMVGELMFVDTYEDMDTYKIESKNRKIIPVFPIADTKYTEIETDENCPGAIALQGTPNGHAGIISAEISTMRPEAGFPYIVGIQGPNGEVIDDWNEFCRLSGVKNGDSVTVNCWSPDTGDGVINKGEDLDLQEKWQDYWRNNQYVIDEPIITPNNIKINIGAIISIPEAAEAVNKARFAYIGLFRMEEVYRRGIFDPRLPNEYRGVACHPNWYFENGYGDVFEDHLFSNLKTLVDGFPDKPITIRAMDFQGPDMKVLRYADSYQKNEEEAGALIGNRGAYLFRNNQTIFDNEARVIKRLLTYIKESGKQNTIKYMYPFFRSNNDAELFVKLALEHNLMDGQESLKLGIMLEVPSNIDTTSFFTAITDHPLIKTKFDGKLPFSFASIGMNDLYQFYAGRYRNSKELINEYRSFEQYFYEVAIPQIVKGCKSFGIELATCGDAPGKDPNIARHLLDIGIENIGVSPAYLGPTHTTLLNHVQDLKKRREWTVPFFSKLKA